jgi:hypothetical protein
MSLVTDNSSLLCLYLYSLLYPFYIMFNEIKNV